MSAGRGFLNDGADGGRLALRVHPRARRNELGPASGDELKVKVTAPPVDSAANDAVIKLLAKQLGCSKSSIRLLRGQTSRSKVVEIRGMAAGDILKRLSD